MLFKTNTNDEKGCFLRHTQMMKKDQISKFRIVHPVLFWICLLVFLANFSHAQVIITGAENLVTLEDVAIYNSKSNISIEKCSVENNTFITNLDQIYVAVGTVIIGIESPEKYSSKISSIEKPKTKNKAETAEPKDRKDIASTENSIRNQTFFNRLDHGSNFKYNSCKKGYFAIVSSGKIGKNFIYK